jgi:hypothetical protein
MRASRVASVRPSESRRTSGRQRIVSKKPKPKSQSEPKSPSEPAHSKPTLFDVIFGIDLRTVGLFRIALAVYLLFDLVGRCPNLIAHYTDSGVFPRDAIAEQWSNGPPFQQYYAGLSLHALTGDASGIIALFAINFLILFALLIGYRSRLFAFLAWVFLISIQNRNPHVLHGGDQMCRMMAFWAMFLPLGARFSVDGLCAVQKAYGVTVSQRALSFGTAAVIFQTAMVYWFTAALKNSPVWHADGSALWYALNIEQYETVLGRLFLQIAPIWLLKIATWASLGLEAIGPSLIFLPYRVPQVRIGLVLAFWVFHLVLIGGLIDVGPLPGSSALLWVPLIPTLFWEKATVWWQKGTKNSLRGRLAAFRTTIIAWRNQNILARVNRREPLPNLRSTKIAQIVAAFLIFYVGLWNLRGVDKNRFPVLPDQLNFVANVLRLDQWWGMFAPQPMTEDGWGILVVTLADGSEIDLYRGGKPVVWTKPTSIASEYPNERIRKYLMNLWDRNHSAERPRYFAYVRENWELEHPEPGKKIKAMNLYFMVRVTPPMGQKKPEPKKMLLLSETYTAV